MSGFKNMKYTYRKPMPTFSIFRISYLLNLLHFHVCAYQNRFVWYNHVGSHSSSCFRLYRNWVKLLDTLLPTTATLRPYHTDFYRRLTVCYGQLTYGAEVPSTPGPTCLIDEIVGLPACSVTVAQSVRAPPPGSPGETSPAHGPRWPLPSGWLSDQMWVGGCKLSSREFPQSSGVDVVVHASSMLVWSHPRTFPGSLVPHS